MPAVILHLGSFVEHGDSLGIGRVAGIDGDQAKIEYFESVAEPVVHCESLPVRACRPVRLQTQTRVFRLNSATGDWTPGRITGGSPPIYFVRFPNTDLDLPVQETELRVRWDRPIRDPVDVMAATANETPLFHAAGARHAPPADIPAEVVATTELDTGGRVE